MEGRGKEFISNASVEITDTGFSEKKRARILEGKQTDNSQAQKRKPVPAGRKKISKILIRRDITQSLPKEPVDLIK